MVDARRWWRATTPIRRCSRGSPRPGRPRPGRTRSRCTTSPCRRRCRRGGRRDRGGGDGGALAADRREAVRERPRLRGGAERRISKRYPKDRVFGSTTSSARSRSRNCSCCASPTRCSSRSGPGSGSTTSRSRWPRTSTSPTAARLRRVGTVRGACGPHLAGARLAGHEPPTSEGADDQRDVKHRLLCAMRAIAGRGRARPLRRVHRDAWRRGGVDHETYVALTLHVETGGGWAAGLPARGEGAAGDAARRRRGAAHPPKPLFTGSSDAPPPNRLRLRVQPDAGITITLLARQPATRRGGADPDRGRLPKVLGPTHAAYQQIFADAWRATRRTSPGSTTWRRPGRIVGLILDASTRTPPLRQGTWGPDAAAILPGPGGWVELPPPAS